MPLWKLRRFRRRNKKTAAAEQPCLSDPAQLGEQFHAAADLQTQSATAPPPSLPSSPELLSSLLDQEFYLVEILKYLVDDGGLPEYRRVCRSWANAGRQLPVKLTDMQFSDLQRALEIFPNASHLSLRNSNERESMETCFLRLSQFRGLKSLKLNFCSLTIDSCNCLNCFQSLRSLVSLSLLDKTTNASPALYASLRILTQLTALHLDKPENPFWSTDPLTELQKLCDLTLKASFLWNASGDCMFPFLDALTHLAVLWDRSPERHIGQKALEAAGAYAPNLVSLAFRFPVRLLQADPNDWSKLKDCQNLKALSVTVAERDDSFFQTLRELDKLECLKIYGPFNQRSLRVQRAIFGLTGLRSLTLNSSAVFAEVGIDPYPLSSLTQLTSLVMRGTHFGMSLSSLTQLVRLEVITHQERPAELPRCLANMTQLETLKLATVNASEMESALFAQLVNLKSLRLSVLGDVHDDFIASLSCLEELTHFEYQQYSGSTRTPAYITSFALLKSLRSLTISAREEWDWWRCFRYQNFPNLRRLEVPFEELSEDGKRELYKKLPCLNRLICHRK